MVFYYAVHRQRLLLILSNKYIKDSMNIVALVFALGISFLWGFSPILHKVALREISSHSAMIVGSVFYTVCLVIYAFVFRKVIIHDVGHMTSHPWIFCYLAFTAIVCGFLTNIIYFSILKKYDSHIISALIYSSPVFTLIMAYLLLQERITVQGFFGVVFITIGVVFIAFNK